MMTYSREGDRGVLSARPPRGPLPSGVPSTGASETGVYVCVYIYIYTHVYFIYIYIYI